MRFLENKGYYFVSLIIGSVSVSLIIINLLDLWRGFPLDFRLSTVLAHFLRMVFISGCVFLSIVSIQIEYRILRVLIAFCVATVAFSGYVAFFAYSKQLNFEYGTGFFLHGIRAGAIGATVVAILDFYLAQNRIDR